MQLRKTQIIVETTGTDEVGLPDGPITRAAALAVIRNPFAGRHGEDLEPLFVLGAALGEQLMARIAAQLPNPAVAYGKAALVGTDGLMEHGAACIHPRLGAPMRAAIGGGAALIPANVKIGAVGGVIDVPLGHKDNPWSFPHIDTWSLMAGDAPLPGEIVVIMALSDGPRLRHRVGPGPKQP